MVKKMSYWDIFYFVILLALSVVLISFYFSATTLDTHYPDWIVHAFRIKSLQADGLSSWTHEWSNGISLWRSYQFVPHILTLGVTNLFHVSITRAMVLITIFSFIFLRLSLYVILRLLKFSPTTAFLCAILSFDIAQYWGGVADFSLLFGFTFFPLMLFLWINYYKGRLSYLFPYLIGLSFYIHPILGYSLFVLWAIGIVFSQKKIISLGHIVQFIIFLAASSLFWAPILIKESYEYSSPVFANKYFLNLVLSGYQYFGLSLLLLFAFALSTFRMFFHFEKAFDWIKVLYVFIAIYLVLIVIGLNIDLPKALAQLQFTRGVTLVGIGIIFIFAGVIERVLMIRSAAFKGALLVFFCLSLIEGIWFISVYSPDPGKNLPEAIAGYKKLHPQTDLTDGHIWTSSIGESGYYTPLTSKFPYSYMGHLESNQISPRISPLVLYQPYNDTVPQSNITRLNDYFKISGVKYVFFDQQSPFTKTLLASDKQIYKDLGQIQEKDSVFHAFAVPWQPRDAIAINQTYAKFMEPFPFTLQLTEINDQITLDEYVRKFVTMLYAPNNIKLDVSYPTSETIAVTIPKSLQTNIVYLNESYDKGWRGYFNNQAVVLKPIGPNFTEIILPVINQGGNLLLKHNWPPSFYISLYVLSLIPLELFFITLAKRFIKKT